MSNIWITIQDRYNSISQELLNLSLNQKDRIQFQKEASKLNDLLEKKNALDALQKEISSLREEVISSDAEMKELFEEEIQLLIKKETVAHKDLDMAMFPPNEHDNRSVFLEIRAGAGGKEAALFVADLLKMYTGYAQSRGWRATVESYSETDLGGFKEVVLHVKGKNAFGHLKFDSGVHRVQRVPTTETQGRVHTSTATVAVLPEAKEVDTTINPADLRIDVYRASGAGGQHVNTTDSAVRITHIPTGVVVTCQDERSQHKNKAKALKMLKSRILLAEMEKQAQAQSKERKDQVGTGMRAEKVRTYNYPQNRVTDHQVSVTLKNLDVVMQGPALHEIIDALCIQDLEERKRKSFVL